jgi:RNA polymerase sigma-70 factor (ECF subfamily)
MEPLTEKKLVEAAKKDPEAFGPLFEEYYPRILKYASFRTGNAEIARDVTSETFFKALKNLWQFRWMGFSFSSWLYRIAGNEINMYFRRSKYEPTSLDAVLEKNPSLSPASKHDLEQELLAAQDAIDSNRDYKMIKEELLKLPVIYQEALTLRFFEEMKISEIASALGKKEGTVKSLISRGLAMLKGSMQPKDNIGIIWSESEKEA